MDIAIDQPTAMIIAAGINTVGVVAAAWTSKRILHKPKMTKVAVTASHTPGRSVWPSLLVIIFSLIMVGVSISGIAPYWESKEPATAKAVLMILIYGLSLLFYISIIAFNAGIIWSRLEHKPH